MKKIIFSVLVLFTFIFFSCNSQHTTNEDVIRVSFTKTDAIPASDLLETTFLKLSTSDSCLIGKVNQLEEINGQYLILDGTIAQRLYLFDKNGKFLRQIGRFGMGPGEYITPISFTINKEKKLLSVIDMEAEKMLYYDLYTFQFLSEQHLPFSTTKMEWLTNDLLAWYSKGTGIDGDNSYIILTDTTYQIKKRFLDQEFPTGYHIGSTSGMYRFSEIMSVYQIFIPNIYRISKDSVRLAYELSFGRNETPPIDFLKKSAGKNGNYIPALKESSYLVSYSVYENEDFMIVPHSAEKTMFYGIYDKKNDKSYNFTQKQLEKDLGVGSFTNPVGKDDNNAFVSLLRPGLMFQLKEKGVVLNEQLEKLVNESQEEDNPILLIYRLKNDKY